MSSDPVRSLKEILIVSGNKIAPVAFLVGIPSLSKMVHQANCATQVTCPSDLCRIPRWWVFELFIYMLYQTLTLNQSVASTYT